MRAPPDPAYDDAMATEVVPSRPAHVLWTGGWDSTFRVLELLLTTDREVVPHYIVDADRLSTTAELQAMERIVQRLRTERPAAAARLRAHVLTLKSDIPKDPEVERRYLQLRELMGLGSQYPWLRRYADTLPGVALELGILRSMGKASTLLQPYLVTEHGVTRLADYAPDAFQLFSPFEFPVANRSKTDMGAEAKRLGVLDILMLTWFCHSPRNGQPCGVCVPCHDAAHMGMKHRLTVTSQLRRRWHGLARTIRSPLRLLSLKRQVE